MVNEEIIFTYFPDLTEIQKQQFQQLYALYFDLNQKINVISRKDIENFYIHHVLHSLTIAKFFNLSPGIKVLDIGTGGGFPGIPLAIFFPSVQFILTDSIGKKITVVNEVIEQLKLENATAINSRVEQISSKVDCVVARAVAPISALYEWTKKSFTSSPNFILLKGGDLQDEIAEFNNKYKKMIVTQYNIFDVINLPFFETKKIITISK